MTPTNLKGNYAMTIVRRRFLQIAAGALGSSFVCRAAWQHLGIELFKAMAGVDLTLVPYAGPTPALEALLAGQADAMFDPMPSSIGLINSGRLRPLP